MNQIIKDIGDVHLGRRFTNGVPLHRRGDRERMVREDFRERLMNVDGATIVVQTGDLFDSFTVPEEVVLDTARIVSEAAQRNPNTIYVFYRGNHDASRDTSKASSFDVFAELLKHVPNVNVFRNVSILTRGDTKIGFIPWHPFDSADILATRLIQEWPDVKFDAVYGHWDIETYGGDNTFNIIPTKILSNVTKAVKTGHIHKPRKFERDGVSVDVVGSMQPYAHGEDPGTTYYKTTRFEDFAAYGETEKAWCRNLNLRVLVKPGQEAEPIDCLSFITKKVDERGDEEADIEVAMASFDMDRLFHEALQESTVGQSVADQVVAKFKELRNKGA